MPRPPRPPRLTPTHLRRICTSQPTTPHRNSSPSSTNPPPQEIFHLPSDLISTLPPHLPPTLPTFLTHPVTRPPCTPTPRPSPLLALGGTTTSKKLIISNALKAHLYVSGKPLFFRKEEYKPEIWSEMVRVVIKNPEKVGEGINRATAGEVGEALESIARCQWGVMGRGFVGDGVRIGGLEVEVQRLVRLKMGFPGLKKAEVKRFENMLVVPIPWNWEVIHRINQRRKLFKDMVIKDQPWWGDCCWWVEG